MLFDVCIKDNKKLFSTPIVHQTAFWSAVKDRLGSGTLAVDFKTRESFIYGNNKKDKPVISDLLVIIEQIDNKHSVAYVPYGPELEPEEEVQAIFLEELSESLRSFLPDDCIMIRYDLCWESLWARDEDCYDSDGRWKGEPGLSAQEIRFNINTVNWNFRKAAFNILPSNTVFVDLDKNTEQLLSAMKPKTRYNIGLSLRKNIRVKTLGTESIDIWYNLYKETAVRNNLYINDIKYFKTVLSVRENDARSPAEVMLLVAELEGKPLAAMFLIISGERGLYLYGASSSAYRNYMPAYALQWEAMKIAKERGCREYDMFGVAPGPDPSHPLYGLYKFKTGFGGSLFHRMGAWDYPLSENKYNFYKSVELNSQGYHNRTN
jgi:lipid II:glycine glycyltransferase (peptidoglycan interpeptide bridge formation enzyme)